MTEHRQLQFSEERSLAIMAMTSIASGKGWCNVVPCVEEDVPDIKVNFTGMWVKHGVPQASFVTQLPREGINRPSSLGVLHLRGRLGKERIAQLLGGAPFQLRQDHAQRGLLFDVPFDTPVVQVLEFMCSMTSALCDFTLSGQWRLDLYLRD
jgi:hypothetical protein